MFGKNRIVANVFAFCVSFVIICASRSALGQYSDASKKIPAYENWIRYDCNLNDPDDLEQAKKNFRAVVNMATASCPSDEDARLARLADIEGATFLDETGELVIWGPQMTDATFMPPLLWDDFVIALRIVDSGQDPTVSIGTYHGRIPTREDMEEARRTGIIPVEYAPNLLGRSHAGLVFFEADRWLKTLAIGIDNFTGEAVQCPVHGYRSTTDRMQVRLEDLKGVRPFGRNWFMPTGIKMAVSTDGYGVRLGYYKMQVKNESYTPDPASQNFADHVENNFDEYCRCYPVFRELVRLYKLVQVARWYSESRFPTQPIFDNYRPVAIETKEFTKQKEAATEQQVAGDRIFWGTLVGGVVFSAPNHYVPAASVSPQNLQYGAPSTWNVPSNTAPTSPVIYKSILGVAPTPAFAMPLIQARPTPTTMVWTVPARGAGPATLVAVIPIPKPSATRRAPMSAPPAPPFPPPAAPPVAPEAAPLPPAPAPDMSQLSPVEVPAAAPDPSVQAFKESPVKDIEQLPAYGNWIHCNCNQNDALVITMSFNRVNGVIPRETIRFFRS